LGRCFSGALESAICSLLDADRPRFLETRVPGTAVSSLTKQMGSAKLTDMRPPTGCRLALPLALFSLVPGPAKAAEDARAHLVDPKTTAIRGISIEMAERRVFERLGRPRSVKTVHSELEDKSVKTVRYDGLKIDFVDGSIYGLSCSAQSCRTDRGVTVGDVRSKIIEVYGPGDPPNEGSGRDTLSYPLRGIDVYLVFVLEKDRVVGIEFFCDYS
jgi:hypothetical protein